MRVGMLRCIWSALALACGAVQAFSAPPAPAETASSGPMRFEWRKEGPAELCAPRCRVWISAAGYITADTPREFDKFTNTSGDVRGAVLVLDSDGGSVLGTLALGRMIRNLDMVTTIGRTTALPDARGEPRAALAPEGTCESMCA